MAETDTKTKKKTYNFELKKKYQYLAHYRKKERPPVERIKDAVRTLLTPKKEEKAAEGAPSHAPPGGFNFVVFGAFIFIALIVLVLGWLFLTTQVFVPSTGFNPPSEKPDIENSIISGNVLSAGERANPQRVAAVMISYNTSNIANYSINLSTYDEELPSEVFILNSERFEAGMYPDFILALRSNLAKRKIMLNEITLKQLETIPQGAVVVVPNGVIPMEMLGVESKLTPTTLANRGVVVIYVGQAFTKMYNGTFVQNTPDQVLKSVPFRFDENAVMTSGPEVHIDDPLYRVDPTSGWTGGVEYGSVSFAKKGNGAFIFLPQTLDTGWHGNFTSAADDVSHIIFNMPWVQPNAPSKGYLLTNQTYYAGQRYFFSAPFTKPNVTVKVDFTGYSQTSDFPVRETLFIRLDKERNNDMFIALNNKVVSTNISGNNVVIKAVLREPKPAKPSMFLTITDSNGTEIESIGMGNRDVQADNSFELPVYMDRGEYILGLMDDESNLYAQAYVDVVSVDIIHVGVNPQKPASYYFDITMEGQPYTLKHVTATVDGGKLGTYEFNDVSSMNIDLGRFTGDGPLPLGNHTFSFIAGVPPGGLKIDVLVKREAFRSFFTEPPFIVTILLTGAMVALGIIFARQEATYFALDIPDFPPVARTKIPLQPDSILAIFEKTNEAYRWHCTPLAVSEIKNGFKDIFYQGKPVYITDYNVEFLLDSLEKRGMVKETIGYYGLVSWEQKTKRSVEYLAIMRRLRDICVNNAIPFTQLEESKEADSILTVVGQQMYLHFYEKGCDPHILLKKVLPTIGRGISIILFKSAADKASFQTLLNSAVSVAPLIAKMELDSSSLLMLSVEELEKMLLEFKSM